jgi:predicted CXXCH cytochrome family protein
MHVAFAVIGTSARALANGVSPSKALESLLQTRASSGLPVLDAKLRGEFDGASSATKALIEAAVQSELVTSAEHLRDLLTVASSEPKMQLLFADNCVLCHSDPESQGPRTLLSLGPSAHGSAPHMDLGNAVADTHMKKGIGCAGCHGGDPASDGVEHQHVAAWPKPSERQASHAWVPGFCARCHADADAMRGHRPDLPTDQFAKYQLSRHWQSLAARPGSAAAECASCHGTHGIFPASDPRSSVHSLRVGATCNRCHSDAATMAGVVTPSGTPIATHQLADLQRSVHGMSLRTGNLSAPTCNDCHGDHAGTPKNAGSVRQSCQGCHTHNSTLMAGSKHKEAFAKHGFAPCGACHGDHAVMATSDTMLSPLADGLCTTCHDEFAKDNPECALAARHMHATLTELASFEEALPGTIAQLAHRGLDTEPIEASRQTLLDALKQARSQVHAFDRKAFDEVAASGYSARAVVVGQIAQAEGDQRSRRIGLVVTIALALLLMVLLLAKIRQIESRDHR